MQPSIAKACSSLFTTCDSKIADVSHVMLRYEELEGALSIAEQHLNNNEQQQATQQLKRQLHQVQQQLQDGSMAMQELQKQLEGAQAARQQAVDDHAAAVQQHETVQVFTPH